MHDVVSSRPVIHLDRALQKSQLKVLVHFASKQLYLIMIRVNIFLLHLFAKSRLDHDCLEEHAVLVIKTLHLLLVQTLYFIQVFIFLLECMLEM